MIRAAVEYEPADNPRQHAACVLIRHELTLPFPPSTNQIWKWVGRRVIRSPEYESWLRSCDGCVLEQLGLPAYRRTIRGKYRLTLALDMRRFRQIDADNTLKSTSDALQRNRLIDNDKNCWEIFVSWREFEIDGGPFCAVCVEQI